MWKPRSRGFRLETIRLAKGKLVMQNINPANPSGSLKKACAAEPPYSKTRCVTVAEELHFFPLYWKPMTA